MYQIPFLSIPRNRPLTANELRLQIDELRLHTHKDWPQNLPVGDILLRCDHLVESDVSQVLIVHGSADKVSVLSIPLTCHIHPIGPQLCLLEGAKELYDKLPATDKTFSTYEVGSDHRV